MTSETARFDHLVLLASDLGRSVAFYGRALPPLGLNLTREWVWVGEGGVAVDLQQAKADQAYARYGPGLNHFSFRLESQEAFERVLRLYTAAGLDVPPTQDFGDALSVFMPDPDGLRLEVTWYRETSA
ncbi:VOC family protein [Caulobacter sp. NIBR2454]|uniref:VOC family protein n=1 Tax=Caulobacter sp. NIBR2454 TaxID=3015996 RepID=UPI0022B6961C|nr:VOC family protein [Caulobacter sp. NIBR2454]